MQYIDWVQHEKGSLQIQIMCNRQIHHQIIRINNDYIKESVCHLQPYCIYIVCKNECLIIPRMGKFWHLKGYLLPNFVNIFINSHFLSLDAKYVFSTSVTPENFASAWHLRKTFKEFSFFSIQNEVQYYLHEKKSCIQINAKVLIQCWDTLITHLKVDWNM